MPVAVRVVLLGALLFVSGVAVTVGVAMWSAAAAWVVAGVLGAAWSFVTFGADR